VCSKSPHHHLVEDAIAAGKAEAAKPIIDQKPLVFRNPRNSKKIVGF
jgi:pyrroloquinoline quinone biosynthesis protein E